MTTFPLFHSISCFNGVQVVAAAIFAASEGHRNPASWVGRTLTNHLAQHVRFHHHHALYSQILRCQHSLATAEAASYPQNTEAKIQQKEKSRGLRLKLRDAYLI